VGGTPNKARKGVEKFSVLVGCKFRRYVAVLRASAQYGEGMLA
jgi:hypothetical protein